MVSSELFWLLSEKKCSRDAIDWISTNWERNFEWLGTRRYLYLCRWMLCWEFVREECYEGEARLGPKLVRKRPCNFSVLNSRMFRVWARPRSSCGKSITQDAVRRGSLLWLTLVVEVGCLGRRCRADRHNLFLAGLKSVILHEAQAAAASISTR